MLPVIDARRQASNTVQRRGNAWLEVSGGSAAQQRDLIGRLRVTVRPGPDEGDAARDAARLGAAADARAKHFH